ncbi:hypothetical protein FQA39_LY11853 [Lamprigera yunnana]|nr:hypothetical protein FQA39_LY11853 [Lamprigera yunnana]
MSPSLSFDAGNFVVSVDDQLATENLYGRKNIAILTTTTTMNQFLETTKPTFEFIKKMWMLYAEQNLTKAIDLKSAVERLYEKLGALEFDANHEAIYGMERYYTVQQC